MIATYGPGRRNCRFDVVEIAALDEWPHGLLPDCLLLVMDASDVPSDRLSALADRLVTRGLSMVYCRGEDCERVHDIFEESEVTFELDGHLVRPADSVVISTWHEDEPFSDTLFAFAMFAPHETYPMPTVRTVVLVDQPDRARDVHRWLPAFCERR
jgi:hypothetical protein